MSILITLTAKIRHLQMQHLVLRTNRNINPAAKHVTSRPYSTCTCRSILNIKKITSQKHEQCFYLITRSTQRNRHLGLLSTTFKAQLHHQIHYCTSKSGSDHNVTHQKSGSEIEEFTENEVHTEISREWANLAESRQKQKEQREANVPKETDIAIIGGGSFGLSVAYWLKKQHPTGYHVTVIERDPTYCRAATTLSVGSIRQQFSLVENIKLSIQSSEFLRNIREHLSVLDLDPPDIQFHPQGYLLLAKDSNGQDVLERNYITQRECNAQTELLKPSMLKNRYPWLKTDDLTLGSYGLANEGWFDPWLYLSALKVKCLSMGVHFVKGEAVAFEDSKITMSSYVADDGTRKNRTKLETVKIKVDDKVYPLKFAMVVNCAGPWAGEVAKLAGIGTAKDGPLSVALPVEPRKRYVYVVHCPDGPGMNMPMLIDPSGVYVRREGLSGHYICGASPVEGEEPSTDNLDVDYEFFNDHIWPILADRIPVFENLKLKSAWAGFYDYNYFDQNLIIGNHPYHRNFLLAAGCSGHGVQQSPAIGRALAEYILEIDYISIDLTRMSFDRILQNEKLLEEGPFII